MPGRNYFTRSRNIYTREENGERGVEEGRRGNVLCRSSESWPFDRNQSASDISDELLGDPCRWIEEKSRQRIAVEIAGDTFYASAALNPPFFSSGPAFPLRPRTRGRRRTFRNVTRFPAIFHDGEAIDLSTRRGGMRVRTRGTDDR